MVLFVALPVGGDVTGVAYWNGVEMRRVAEFIYDLEGCRLLTFNPVGIYGVDQFEGVLFRDFADQTQRVIEGSFYGHHFSAVDESLRKFAQRDIAVWQKHDAVYPAACGVCGGGGAGVAGRRAHDRAGSAFVRLGDCHGHTAVFKRSGGIEAFVLKVDSQVRGDCRGESRRWDQRCIPFVEGHNGCGLTHRQERPVTINYSSWHRRPIPRLLGDVVVPRLQRYTLPCQHWPEDLHRGYQKRRRAAQTHPLSKSRSLRQ